MSTTEVGTGDNFQGLPGIITRVDPATNRITGRFHVGEGDLGVAAGEGSLWVTEATQFSPSTLLQIDPHSLQIEARIQVGRDALSVATGFGSVWVSNSQDGTVMRVDPVTNDILATVSIPDGTSGLVVAPDGIWTSDRDGKGLLSRIDPASNAVTDRITLPLLPPGGEGYVETFGFGSLWARSIPHTIYRVAPGR